MADKIVQEQANWVLKYCLGLVPLLCYLGLQKHSRDSTVKVFIECYQWKIAGWYFFGDLGDLWMTISACVSWKSTPSRCATLIVTSRQGDTNWIGDFLVPNQDRTVIVKVKKLINWCIWGICQRLSGVNRWFLGDHTEGKIDCKKGDLRRHRCNGFAWLCK